MPLYKMLHMCQWQIGAPLSYSGSFLFQTFPNVVGGMVRPNHQLDHLWGLFLIVLYENTQH